MENRRARPGAVRLHFDYDSFRTPPDPRSPPGSGRCFDPMLWRAFKLSILVAFRASEVTDPRDAWTGRQAARNLGQTTRLFVGLYGMGDEQYVYAMPKGYERGLKIRPYRIERESRRAFRRLVELNPEVRFAPTSLELRGTP